MRIILIIGGILADIYLTSMFFVFWYRQDLINMIGVAICSMILGTILKSMIGGLE